MLSTEPIIPKQSELLKPVLDSLGDGKEYSVDQIVENVIKAMGIDPIVADIESSSAKNKSQLKYNIEWALDRLRKLELVESRQKTFRNITQRGLEVLRSGIDINTLKTSSKEGNSYSFFDLLFAHGLLVDTLLVEDYLLSLKSKQFMILSGGTGIGKTKIATLYGQYISQSEVESSDGSTLTFEVTITDKFATNRGFTLSSDIIKTLLPDGKDSLDGMYEFTLAGCEGVAKINMTPRIWFEPKANYWDDLLDKVDKASKISNKAILTLKRPAESTGSGNYEVIPVGSNWTDNRHIIGYRNTISGTYSKTPALNLIISASQDASEPHLLILDEMNLSHVERYFSDIISAMESHEPINLDSEGIDNTPDFIPLGDNLFIIGTVNMDETTYAFSPKVLDRANVLEFESSSVVDYCKGLSSQYEPHGDVGFLQDCMRGLECRKMKAPEILREIGPSFSNEFISDFNELQNIMAAMSLPFGFRTIDEVCRFMYVAWIYEGRGSFTNWKRYFDSQIKQKILPKIHGNSVISGPLNELQAFCTNREYPRSAERVKRMVVTLEAQRYVSFNC